MRTLMPPASATKVTDLAALHRFGGHQELIGDHGAARDRPAGGQSDRDGRIIEVARRQLRDIALLDPHILVGQHAARHDGTRGDGHRRGADDSDRHIEMPRPSARAAQFDQDPIAHVCAGTDHRLDRQAAALELQVRGSIGPTTNRCLSVSAGKLQRRLGFRERLELREDPADRQPSTGAAQRASAAKLNSKTQRRYFDGIRMVHITSKRRAMRARRQRARHCRAARPAARHRGRAAAMSGPLAAARGNLCRARRA